MDLRARASLKTGQRTRGTGSDDNEELFLRHADHLPPPAAKDDETARGKRPRDGHRSEHSAIRFDAKLFLGTEGGVKTVVFRETLSLGGEQDEPGRVLKDNLFRAEAAQQRCEKFLRQIAKCPVHTKHVPQFFRTQPAELRDQRKRLLNQRGCV